MSIVQSAVRHLFPAQSFPKTWLDRKLTDVKLLAIDLELSALDPRKAAILSAGWVPGCAGRVDFSACEYHLVSSSASLGQSPVIHGLVEADLKQGASVVSVLQALAGFAEDHLWVFHNSKLDMSVIIRAARALSFELPPIVSLDTMRLELYLLNKSPGSFPPRAVRLEQACRAHSLPSFAAHNALDDAMAAMLLCYAQLNDLDPRGKASVHTLLHTGAFTRY